jgi:hypothetical protein
MISQSSSCQSNTYLYTIPNPLTDRKEGGREGKRERGREGGWKDKIEEGSGRRRKVRRERRESGEEGNGKDQF